MGTDSCNVIVTHARNPLVHIALLSKLVGPLVFLRGPGKLVAQAFLELPCAALRRAVGVELAPSRHRAARQAWASANASLWAAAQAAASAGVQPGASGDLAYASDASPFSGKSDASAESSSGRSALGGADSGPLMLVKRCTSVDGQAREPEFVEASFLEVKH